jgi:iron complex transport system substrate-binding protein
VSPRVASFLPSATEIAWALGAGAELVGVSHACDFPPEVRALPVLTRARVRADAPDREIHARVRELAGAGRDLYEVDVEGLRRVAPDVVLTQDLCEVCAVTPEGVRAALDAAGLDARVVVLRADSLAAVARDAIDVGEALERADVGHALARRFEERLTEVFSRTAGLPRRRVASLEWLDPPFAAGHWVPQMVRLAGGEEVIGQEAKPSREVSWAEVEAVRPEVLGVLPCGFDLERSRTSWSAARERLAGAGSPLVAAEALLLDASALFSRPGPRLVRGVEVLAGLLHPDAGFPPPGPDEGARA